MSDATETLGPLERVAVAIAASVDASDLDRLGRVEGLRATGRLLDRCSQSRTGSGGMAGAALYREWRAGLDELKQAEHDADWNSLVERLVADDG